MKFHTMLTFCLLGLSVGCAPVGDDDPSELASTAQAATIQCTPSLCPDQPVSGQLPPACTTSPRTVSCTVRNVTRTLPTTVSRSCTSSSNCAIRQVIPVAGGQVQVIGLNNKSDNLAAFQSWASYSCPATLPTAAGFVYVTDDGASTGPYYVSCCNYRCVTRR